MLVCVIHIIYTEIRFQAELQLALEISRAEQEPFTAQQEQGGVDTEFEGSTYHCNSLHHPFTNDTHDVDAMTTTNMDMTNNIGQTSVNGYHGDDDDEDFIELLGMHRRSPIFI